MGDDLAPTAEQIEIAIRRVRAWREDMDAPVPTLEIDLILSQADIITDTVRMWEE